MTILTSSMETPPHLIAQRDYIAASYKKFKAMEGLQIACYGAGFISLAEQAGRIARDLDASLAPLCAEYERALQDAWFAEQEKLLMTSTGNL